MTREKRVNITIDNRNVKAKPNQTILQAAKANGFYIPSLCALEHLPSYGACRLCIVEVDGIRGYPTSCTTPVEEGMVIRTDTAELRSLRQEVLKLLLSEHPASCLFCQEQDECKDYQGTIRKVGLTTGCRYCPNDRRCELQLITEKVGLVETSYPVYYRNLPVEKNDPFYDRDYNLCILCGRCIRVCNEVRLNGTLSFKQRGKQTTIGPAFARTHLEAGCEFCGACVSVCPTGALSVKASKWYGRPERTVGTTCNYCPLGCRLLLQVKRDEVIDVLPDYDSPADAGIVCVKGRFAIPELVNSPERLTTPLRLTSIGYEVISWEQAVDEAASRLSGLKAEDFLMVLSPQLATEEIFAAQKFSREVVGSDNIVPSFMLDLGHDLPLFLDLAAGSVTVEKAGEADCIISAGFDSTYGFSRLGLAVKKAAQGGRTVVTINAAESNLDMYAEAAVTLGSSRLGTFMTSVVDQYARAGGKEKAGKGKLPPKDDAARVVSLMRKAAKGVIIAGPDLITGEGRSAVFEAIKALRDEHSWDVIVMHPYTNLMGTLFAGGMAGLRPGGVAGSGTGGKGNSVRLPFPAVDLERRRKVVYLVGESPDGWLPPCDYLVYQNALAADSPRQPDLVLPSSLFTESPGTVINYEGMILPVQKAVEPPGQALPDWRILGMIAQRVKKGAMKYQGVASVQRDLKRSVKEFSEKEKRIEFPKLTMEAGGKGGKDRTRKARDQGRQYRFRGVPLSRSVPGMRVLEEGRTPQASTGKE